MGDEDWTTVERKKKSHKAIAPTPTPQSNIDKSNLAQKHAKANSRPQTSNSKPRQKTKAANAKKTAPPPGPTATQPSVSINSEVDFPALGQVTESRRPPRVTANTNDGSHGTNAVSLIADAESNSNGGHAGKANRRRQKRAAAKGEASSTHSLEATNIESTGNGTENGAVLAVAHGGSKQVSIATQRGKGAGSKHGETNHNAQSDGKRKKKGAGKQGDMPANSLDAGPTTNQNIVKRPSATATGDAPAQTVSNNPAKAKKSAANGTAKNRTESQWGRAQGTTGALTLAQRVQTNAAPNQKSAAKTPGLLVVPKGAPGPPAKKPKTGQSFELSLLDLVKKKPEPSKATPIRKGIATTRTKRQDLNSPRAVPANILDSRPPTQRRAKERETPKKNRPSTLRKVILQHRARQKAARQEKSQLRAQPVKDLKENEPSNEREGPLGAASEWESDNEDDGANQSKDDTTTAVEALAAVPPPATNEQPARRKKRRKKARGKKSPADQSDVAVTLSTGDQSNTVVSKELDEQQNRTKKRRQKNKKKKQTAAEGPESTATAPRPELSERRVWDYDFFHGTTTSPGTCRYANIARKHSASFRGYATQNQVDGLNDACKELLGMLLVFQQRKLQQDPIKAAMRRRYFMGLNEVAKAVLRGKVRCVIAPTDMEDVHLPGGLNDKLRSLLAACVTHNVTVVHALTRRSLGRTLKTLRPTSVVGIQDFSGANDVYNRMVELAKEGRVRYLEDIDRHIPPCTGQCLETAPKQTSIADSASIKPRGRHEVVVHVERGAKVSFTFDTNTGDVRFGAILRYNDGSESVLVNPHRAHTESGELQCDAEGSVVFGFDNSLSGVNSRGVSYTVKVGYPAEPAPTSAQ